MRYFAAAVLVCLVAGGCTAASSRTTVPSEATTSAPASGSATSTTVAPVSTTATTGYMQERCLGEEPVMELGETLAFFAQCGSSGTAPYPIFRPGIQRLSVQKAIVEMLKGTTPEERELGLSTGFDLVVELDRVNVLAEVDADGLATIDFRLGGERWGPGSAASTSSQLFSFLDPLEATVFASPEVRGLDRSTLCWGESDCTGVTTRQQWEGTLFVNSGVLFHRGCDLLAAWSSLGCTIGGVAVISDATVVNVAAGDTLKMRDGAGIEFSQVGELAPGATVEVLDASDMAADGGLWRLVMAPEPGYGWVNAAYLDLVRTPDQALVDAFVAFAKKRDATTFSALALGDRVGLGLGATLVRTVNVDELEDPATWEMALDGFRGMSGVLSPLDALGQLDDYTVTVGPHEHCASGPVAAPNGFEDYTRISVQPVLGVQDSCLMWFTVDFFISNDGNVDAITYDLWEP